MNYGSIRVLLIEDDPNHAKALDAMLKRVKEFDYVLVHCFKLHDGVKELKTTRFDVVLLDLNLPDGEGIETFRNLHANFPEIPVVILTAMINQEIALQTLKEGAQEYLFKGEFDGQDLSQAMIHSIARFKYLLALK